MGRTKLTDAQAGFADGLNTVSDPSALGPAQARALQNVVLTAYGSALRRKGTQKVSAAQPNGSAGVSGGIWWPSQGYYVVTAGSNLYVSNGATIPMTWTSIASAAGTVSVNPVFRVFSGVAGAETLYFSNVGYLSSLAIGNTYTPVVTGTPNLDGIEVYNNRLWGWSHGLNALYFSNLASAAGSIGGDSLGVGASGGGQINVVTFGASNIFTCAVIGSSLLIFHKRGISRLTGFGLSDITVQPQAVTPDFLLVGPFAVTTYNGIGWAVSFAGLAMVTENGVTFVGTPEKPDPLPAAIAQLVSLGLSPITSIRVAYDSVLQHVMVTIPLFGVYVYNTILGSWSGPWTGPYTISGTNAGGCFIQFPGNSGTTTPSVLFSDESGWVYQTNTIGPFGFYLDGIASDGSGGSVIPMQINCRRMFGQAPGVAGGARAYAKSWRWVNVLAALQVLATAPVVTMSAEYGGSSSVTLSGLTAAQQPYYVPAGGVGPSLDVSISDHGTEASEYALVEVEGFYLGQR